MTGLLYGNRGLNLLLAMLAFALLLYAGRWLHLRIWRARQTRRARRQRFDALMKRLAETGQITN